MLLEKGGEQVNISIGEQYIKMAEEKVAIGDIDGAIDLLFQCNSQNPDNVDVYKRLAVLMISKQTYQSARNMLVKAIDFKPDDATLYFHLSTVCHLAGDHSASEAAFQKAIAIDPLLNEAITKSIESTWNSIDQKSGAKLEKELSGLLSQVNQHIRLSKTVTENLEALAKRIGKILGHSAIPTHPDASLPGYFIDNNLKEDLSSTKGRSIDTLQSPLYNQTLSENPDKNEAQSSTYDAAEEYLHERIQIGEKLNLDGPLPIDELNHAIQLLTTIFSDPEAFFSSQEHQNEITPAFFALLQLNIETALKDGDYHLAENLKNIRQLLSSTSGIEIPQEKTEAGSISPTPSENEKDDKCPSLIFFHIPKAGGTSLDAILERQFDRSQVYTMDRIKVEESASEFKNLAFEERMKYKLLKGHMWFGLRLHEHMAQPCRYITMLREPIDRVVSHYYYAKRTSNHYLYEKIAAEQITLKEYVTRQLTLEVNNGQTRLFAELKHPVPYGESPQELLESAKQNLHDYFAMVGLMERFDESLLMMKRLFGWDSVFYERKNVSKERSAIQELPADVLDVIVEYNQLDIQLYQFVQALLDDMIKQQDESFFRELQEFQIINQEYSQKTNDT